MEGGGVYFVENTAVADVKSKDLFISVEMQFDSLGIQHLQERESFSSYYEAYFHTTLPKKPKAINWLRTNECCTTRDSFGIGCYCPVRPECEKVRPYRRCFIPYSQNTKASRKASAISSNIEDQTFMLYFFQRRRSLPNYFLAIALLKPVPNGMQVWWDDPVMPTAEFLLTWQKEGNNKVEGHKFVERTARSYVVKGLEDCQMYTFNLIAMDWKYRQFGAGRKSGMTDDHDVIIIIDSMTSVFNTDASLLYKADGTTRRPMWQEFICIQEDDQGPQPKPLAQKPKRKAVAFGGKCECIAVSTAQVATCPNSRPGGPGTVISPESDPHLRLMRFICIYQPT
ncbi:hypothetical protein CLF_109748 [Clonorchis sinensis]|uniref:Uncharacterized protein n=1 Tax=Clonorchis sinensis TaxID=79923 RepID=G7YJR6_CLOSI|nr:hypothetical protein CLF_109748 [Clonorchis sinensis]